jgi:hypothetical protein
MRRRLAWLTAAATSLALITAPGPVQSETAHRCHGPWTEEAVRSPIEIDRSFTCPRPRVELSIHYPHSVDGQITFQDREPVGEPSEHDDIRFVLASKGGAGRPYVVYGGKRYNLSNVHFHGHAEHKFAGEPFAPVEAHLVHESTHGPGYVVLSVLLDPEWSGGSSAHDRLMKAPPALGESKQVRGVHLRDLLPDDRTTYRYTGSLTTPDDAGTYFQPVNWVVFGQRAGARPDVIEAFRSLWPNGSENTRELQDNVPPPAVYQSR